VDDLITENHSRVSLGNIGTLPGPVWRHQMKLRRPTHVGRLVALWFCAISSDLAHGCSPTDRPDDLALQPPSSVVTSAVAVSPSVRWLPDNRRDGDATRRRTAINALYVTFSVAWTLIAIRRLQRVSKRGRYDESHSGARKTFSQGQMGW